MKNSMKRILLHIGLLGATGTMFAMWQEELTKEELQELNQQTLALSGQYQVEQPAPEQPRTHVNVIDALRKQARFLAEEGIRQYHNSVVEHKYVVQQKTDDESTALRERL